MGIRHYIPVLKRWPASKRGGVRVDRSMTGPHGGYFKKPVAPGTKAPPVRHSDATFDVDERASFFVGEWVGLRSEWLAFARWDEEFKLLEVTFKDGFRCSIEADEILADQFANTISKGGWWWDRVISEGRTVREF